MLSSYHCDGFFDNFSLNASFTRSYFVSIGCSKVVPRQKENIRLKIVVSGCTNMLCHISERVIVVRYRPCFCFWARLEALVPKPLLRIAFPTTFSSRRKGLIVFIAISYRPPTPANALARNLHPCLSSNASSFFLA